MNIVYVRAKSFQDARRKLAKDHFEEWTPIRIDDTDLYKFVNPVRKKPLEKELNINKVMKKYKDFLLNNQLI